MTDKIKTKTEPKKEPVEEPKKEVKEEAAPGPVKADISKPKSDQPQYKVLTDDGWGDTMDGLLAPDGSKKGYAGTLGNVIKGFTAENIGDYRIRTSRGWSEWKNTIDTSVEYGDYPVLGIEVKDPNIKIGVHIKGGDWLPITSGEACAMLPIDGIWLKKV